MSSTIAKNPQLVAFRQRDEAGYTRLLHDIRDGKPGAVDALAQAAHISRGDVVTLALEQLDRAEKLLGLNVNTLLNNVAPLDVNTPPAAGHTLASKGVLDVKAPTGPSLSNESRALNGPLETLLAFPTDGEAAAKAVNSKDFRAFQRDVYDALEQTGRLGTAIPLTADFAQSLAHEVAGLPAPARAAFATLLQRHLAGINPARIDVGAVPHLNAMKLAALTVTSSEAQHGTVLVAVRDLAANTSWLHAGDFDKQARPALLRAGVDPSVLGSALPLLAETLGFPPL